MPRNGKKETKKIKNHHWAWQKIFAKNVFILVG